MESIFWGVISLVTTVLFALFGLTQKRISNMDERLRSAPPRDEVQEQIDLRQEVNRALYTELKEDIKDLKAQVRILINKL